MTDSKLLVIKGTSSLTEMVGTKRIRASPSNSNVPSTSQEATNTEINLQHVSDLLLSLTKTVTNLSQVQRDAGPLTSRRSLTHLSVAAFDLRDELNSMEKYIQRPEQLSQINKWDYNMLIYMATSNLVGMAKIWFVPNLFGTYLVRMEGNFEERVFQEG